VNVKDLFSEKKKSDKDQVAKEASKANDEDSIARR